jgi:hypothetical protein
MDGGGGGGRLLSGNRDVGKSPIVLENAIDPGCGNWAAARVRMERALHAPQMFSLGGMVVVW